MYNFCIVFIFKTCYTFNLAKKKLTKERRDPLECIPEGQGEPDWAAEEHTWSWQGLWWPWVSQAERQEGWPCLRPASQPHSSLNKSLPGIVPWFTSRLPSVPFLLDRQVQVDWVCSAPLSRECPDSYHPYSVIPYSCIVSIHWPCPFTAILGFIQRLLNLYFNLDESFYKAIWSYKS